MGKTAYLAIKPTNLNYLKALAWFLLSLLVSCCNDGITKYIGHNLHPWEVTFFRFLFGILTLLPWMLYKGKQAFITSRLKLHLVRGILIFIAIGFWSQGIQNAPITTATIMSFTVPIFVLILAPIFLQEQVSWFVWLTTLIGFAGIFIVLQPHSMTLSPASIYFIVAAGLFGLLDIINKKYVNHEPRLCMLFYSSLIAMVLVSIPATLNWRMPTLHQLVWLLVLGGGSNLILYCLLQAFSLANASALAPFRYVELLISMIVSYSFFQEMPDKYSYIGAAIIIPCTLLIGYHQSRLKA
jgi:S-adenosylmethionine uptake transporter